MKAQYIKSNGIIKEVVPENQSDFSLEELQEFVKGYIEIVQTKDNSLMVLNEEGKLQNLPFNSLATALYKHGASDIIVGDVLICAKHQIK